MSDVLVMTVEKLRIELQRRGKIPASTNKPDLKEALLRAIAEPPIVAQDQYHRLFHLTREMKILIFAFGCRKG